MRCQPQVASACCDVGVAVDLAPTDHALRPSYLHTQTRDPCQYRQGTDVQPAMTHEDMLTLTLGVLYRQLNLAVKPEERVENGLGRGKHWVEAKSERLQRKVAVSSTDQHGVMFT